MDIQKINTVLGQAIRILEDAEIDSLTEDLDEDLTESYVGYGGTTPPDHTPTGGGPYTGGSGGVDNMETAEEQFYSYLMYVAQSCAAETGGTEEEAVKHLEDFAEELSAAGELPAMPDPETATAEEFSTWPNAAKTLGFAKRLSEYVTRMAGGS
jgi:hypothetical protein